MENDNRDQLAEAGESISKYKMILDRLNQVSQEKADLENKLREKDLLVALNEKSYQEGLRDLNRKNSDLLKSKQEEVRSKEEEARLKEEEARSRSAANMQLESDISKLKKEISDLKQERQRNLEKIEELSRNYNDKVPYYESEIKRLKVLLAEKENTVSLQNQKLQQQSQELQQKNQEVQNLRSVADQQKEELEKSKDKIGD